MDIIKVSESEVLINLEIEELKTVKNVLNKVYQAIFNDIPSRIGCSTKEFEALINTVDCIINDNTNKNNELGSCINLHLSLEDALFLSQAMNAVCHGIYIPDFQECIGMEKYKLSIFLDDLLEKIDPYLGSLR